MLWKIRKYFLRFFVKIKTEGGRDINKREVIEKLKSVDIENSEKKKI